MTKQSRAWNLAAEIASLPPAKPWRAGRSEWCLEPASSSLSSPLRGEGYREREEVEMSSAPAIKSSIA
jgi:hypothetical protein